MYLQYPQVVVASVVSSLMFVNQGLQNIVRQFQDGMTKFSFFHN